MIDWQRVKQARKEKGLTQEQVAQHIGISRPTYIKIEDGEKELTLKQAHNLSGLLGISLEENPEDTQRRIDKYESMILAFIAYGGSDGDGRITKTKLAKMLYFADAQTYLDKGGHSMSGLVYRRLPQGPVAYEYLQLVDDLADQHVIDIKFSGLAQMIGAVEPVNVHDLGLQGDEIDRVKRISLAWKDKRTDAIVNYSHEHPTWRKAKEYAPIDMSLLKKWTKPIY